MADTAEFLERATIRMKAFGHDADFFDQPSDTAIFDAYPEVGDLTYRIVVNVDMANLATDPATVYRRDKLDEVNHRDIELAPEAVPEEIRVIRDAFVTLLDEELRGFASEASTAPAR